MTTSKEDWKVEFDQRWINWGEGDNFWKDDIKDFISSLIERERVGERARIMQLTKQWRGYFTDIVDDAEILWTHHALQEKPEWEGMIKGLEGPAKQGITSIDHFLTPQGEDK